MISLKNTLSGTQLFQDSGPLFLPLLLRDPHVLLVGHDVREHSTSQENHVSPPGWIFYSHLKFLQKERSKWSA